MTIQSGSRQVLIQGMCMILAGLFWGIATPLTPYPRLALGAHIQFESNGVLFLVLAIALLAVPHQAGQKTIRVLLVSVLLTWLMVFSEVANAFWGANQMLPIAAKQAGAMGAAAWQEGIVKLTHLLAALGLIASMALIIVGFVRQRTTKQ